MTSISRHDGEERAGTATRGGARRLYGLDAARAVAMLLGVFYHLPIAMLGGGFGFGFGGGGGNPKPSIDNWLHSFRMPLFFMISGIFAAMMLGKYGLRRYLARRWWRIGAPLVVAFVALAGFRYAREHVAWLAGIVVATGGSLILYELIVRPTPLVHIFGPPQPARAEPAPHLTATTAPETAPAG